MVFLPSRRHLLTLMVPLVILIGSLVLPPVASSQATGSLDRARNLELRQEFARARGLYREYLSTNPTSVQAARGWLRTSIRTRDWDAGERALERLRQIDAESATTAKLGTQFYFRQQEYDTALTWGERYRNRANSSWKPFHFLAQIHLEKGQVLTAEEMVESARLRSENNQWVLLDKLLVEYNRQQLSRAMETAEKLREVSSNPTIYWTFTRALSDQYSVEELAQFLGEGAANLPPGTPPIIPPVEESSYRYWWSRMTYRTGDVAAARSALGSPPDTFRSLWLRANLNESTADRKRAQQRVLHQWPDQLIAQWEQSRLVRSTEPLRSERRRTGAGFFYQEFTDNRFLDYPESALSALLRSLEMDPLAERRQFHLARFYRDRGWGKSGRRAARRARTLGYSPPTAVADYLEGLGTPDTHAKPAPPSPTIGVHVRLASPWEGPLDGASALTSIFRHNFFHQPGFHRYQGSIETADELGSMVQGETLAGGINITIENWSDELSAEVELLLPEDRLVSNRFYDSDDMKEWNLLNSTVQSLKDQWPWQGTIYKVTDSGAWVNLGRIHGLTRSDTFTFVSPGPEFPDRLPVDTIHEDRLKLGFPSPYYRTIIPRGTRVRVLRQ